MNNVSDIYKEANSVAELSYYTGNQATCVCMEVCEQY